MIIGFPDAVLEDENLQRTLQDSAGQISQSKKTTKRQAKYNLRINTLGIDEIESRIREIFSNQTRAFKIQLAFSFVLRNNVDGSYRFYYGSHNSSLLDRPSVVSNQEGFDKFIQQLRDIDILEYIRNQRPNSKWVFHLITNMIVTLHFLDFPIGSRVHLPDYILKHRCIISLARDSHHNKPYDDNLCFFRALALHRGSHPRNLERAAKEYFSRYLAASGIKQREFEGVQLSDLSDLEILFETNFNVYSLEENSQARLIVRSHRRFDSTLFLNLFENHFSLITDIKGYCKSFECGRCGRLFRSHYKLKIHTRKCSNNVRYIFPGGAYKNPLNIFEQLEEVEIDVPAEDRFFPHFATFDFECILEQMGAESPENTDKLEWISIHKPVSVSCCSNVPEFEDEVCFVNSDNKLLVEEFLSYLKGMNDASYQNLLAKYDNVFNKLDELIDSECQQSVTHDEEPIYYDESHYEGRYEYLIEQNESSDMSGNVFEGESTSDTDSDKEEEEKPKETNEESDDSNKTNRLEKLKEAFDAYLHELPVIVFNSGKYDINAIKKSFFKLLCGDEESQLKCTVKKNNSSTHE